jgi:glycosyltransferase involved in cell wall biosynthesis
MEILRYSPKERNIPGFAGEDALIRFYKDPAEWKGWNGSEATVIQVTQHLKERDPYTNYGFWDAATRGLDRTPLGPGSQWIGGTGPLTYDEMRAWLRNARVYLYTGTQPASYTLGLIEAMMTGIPVVSIGPTWMRVFPYGPDMFEGHELTRLAYDSPSDARAKLEMLLSDQKHAAEIGCDQRNRAVELFGIDTIREQWREFLG